MNLALATAAFAAALAASPARAQDLPERITFPSADARTTLVGYLYVPEQKRARMPAVVMMHGRAGAYSSLAKGKYDASTLSQRHQMWGRFWQGEGAIALMVDGFGPRGYPAGFPRGSYDDRPATLDEVTVRPLDAYGALGYLRQRPDVVADRIGLQGWSNGGSATLSTMAEGTLPAPGFTAALVFYAGCGLKDKFEAAGYKPTAPVLAFHGTADEEVSYRRCRDLVARSRKLGGDIEIKLYRGAVHGFDDPGRARQAVKANAEAKANSMERSEAFFEQKLFSGLR